MPQKTNYQNSCPICRKVNTISVLTHKLKEYQEGRGHVQDIFPELSNSEREILITGTCDACWTRIFGDKQENEEVTSTDLLAKLVAECRDLISASALDGGAGGGWDAYDPLLTDMRKVVQQSEVYLANVELASKKTNQEPI